MRKTRIVATGALVLAIMAGGTATASALHKDVTLLIDGQARPVSSFALTVGDVLANHNVELEPGDIVTPSPQTSVADGQTIEVNLHRQVIFEIDGVEQTVHTNEATVAGALSAVALEIDLEAAEISRSLAANLAPDSDRIVIVSEKDVNLKVAGKKKAVATTSRTVADLLAEHEVAYDSDDRVKPALSTVLTPKLAVSVDRVEVAEVTREEAIDFGVKASKTGDLWISEKRVTKAGKKGVAKRTYKVVKVNGKVESETKLSEKVLKKPVTQLEEHGTKSSSQGVKINMARAAQWDRIAKCESGGNWGINTGNGYYGGLQFNRQSWTSNGGRDFAALPHQASRAEQITVANRYYAKSGFRPWSCRRVLG